MMKCGRNEKLKRHCNNVKWKLVSVISKIEICDEIIAFNWWREREFLAIKRNGTKGESEFRIPRGNKSKTTEMYAIISMTNWMSHWKLSLCVFLKNVPKDLIEKLQKVERTAQKTIKHHFLPYYIKDPLILFHSP